jgi:hypothetical protein
LFDNVWMIVVTALVLWIPQNAAHEGAHCLAHSAAGDTIKSFWPFPGWRTGSFSFAHMSYQRTGEVSPFVDGLCSAAPQIANTVILCALMPLHLLSLNPIVEAVLTGWAIVNYVDGAVNLATFYRMRPRLSTDGWSTAMLWDLDPWTCRAVAMTWHFWMTVHVIALITL